jgi:chromate reductase
MKLLVFAGALRTDSCNKKFAREAARLVTEAGHEAEFLDLKDYPMPVYDGDIEAATGVPETTKALSKKILGADGVILSTPEYNASIPGALKNVIDWLSRDKPVALTGKHLLLLAASPGALGGTRALWHTRQPFELLNVHVYPNMMGLNDAYNAFDSDGKLKDEKTAGRLKALIDPFLAHIKR